MGAPLIRVTKIRVYPGVAPLAFDDGAWTIDWGLRPGRAAVVAHSPILPLSKGEPTNYLLQYVIRHNQRLDQLKKALGRTKAGPPEGGGA